MPRGLPTPANSTDIKGKDGSAQFPAQGVQMSFELPPPALTADTLNSAGLDSNQLSASANSSAVSSYHLTSPNSPFNNSSAASAAKRRQSGSGKAVTAQFALPPPPTRSRKIIQVKPRQASQVESVAPAGQAPTKMTAAATAAGKSKQEKGKKKQPSSTSAARRKIARKTAHSLIERRRRSKMNEEFGVLKDMIPACTGEMHKLAILQASIEYIRYLHDCVSQLKAQNQNRAQDSSDSQPQQHGTPAFTSTSFSRPPITFGNSNAESYGQRAGNQNGKDDDVEDVEMEDDGNQEAISPTLAIKHPTKSHSHSTSHSHQASISPIVLPQDHRSQHRHQRMSSSSTTLNTALSSNTQHPHPHRKYSYSSTTSRPSITTSAATSPNFRPTTSPFIYPSSAASYTQSPQLYPYTHGDYRYFRSESIASPGYHCQLTSPALAPVGDGEERERESAAMAALMMLNCDRRSVGGGSGSGSEGAVEYKAARGDLSVKDLLSG